MTETSKQIAIFQPKTIPDNPVELSVIETVSTNLDFKPGDLTSIVKNKNRTIRHLPNTDGVDFYLGTEIVKISNAYNSGETPSILVQRECIKALRSDFKSLSVAEVWAAFRAHSAGAFDDKGKGEMYGGKFTAKAFISILAGWKVYKAKAEAAYFKMIEQQQFEEEEKEKAQKAMAVFWPTLKEQIKKLRESTSSDWCQCPVYIFDALRKNNLIDGLETKEIWGPIWERAQAQALSDFSSESQASAAKGGVRVIGDVARASMETKTQESAKTIAKKIALFELVVKNPKFDIDFVTDGLTL